MKAQARDPYAGIPLINPTETQLLKRATEYAARLQKTGADANASLLAAVVLLGAHEISQNLPWGDLGDLGGIARGLEQIAKAIAAERES